MPIQFKVDASKPVLALKNTAKRETGFNHLNSLKFELTHELQCSLDLRDTLNQFFNQVRKLISLGGMQYKNTEKNLELNLGKRFLHQAEYGLSTPDYALGSLHFYRDLPFSEAELQGLEALTGILFYPLRNALLYREALDNSLRDCLTQVGNRAAMEMALKREMELAKRNNEPLCLLIMDIDFFKKINDELGHATGDQVLAHVAAVTKESLRQTDQVFRFGGEEFVILLSDTPLASAQMVANRIRIGVESVPLRLDAQDICATVSIGLALLQHHDERDSFFMRADTALYHAKHAGRNRVATEVDTAAAKVQNAVAF